MEIQMTTIKWGIAEYPTFDYEFQTRRTEISEMKEELIKRRIKV